MTAVKWLEQQLGSKIADANIRISAPKFYELINQAKELEKQQIQLIYASRCSFISCEDSTAEELTNCNCGKRYYNKIFKLE
jgi:hypothetical protein